MDSTTARLIKENADAPVDRLIRAIFATCSDVIDVEDDVRIETADAALELWYGVDDLMLTFSLPNGKASFVKLIHQHRFSRPHIDDLSDYGTNCETVPELVEAISENNYRLLYTD